MSTDDETEITRLRARVRKLNEEHARHTLALAAHQARADQQESRAIHAEKQLARFADQVTQYEELDDLAGRGQRAIDLEAELRRRIECLQRENERLRSPGDAVTRAIATANPNGDQ